MKLSYAVSETLNIVRSIHVEEQRRVEIDDCDVELARSRRASESLPLASARSSAGRALRRYAPGSGPLGGTATSRHAVGELVQRRRR